MHGDHPGVVSRRRRIALAERTDKRIPTRVMWQCRILTSRSTRRRCASSEIRRFLASGSTRMFSRSRTAARVNGIALGAHPSRVATLLQLMQSQP
jgi:hypothetical protein